MHIPILEPAVATTATPPGAALAPTPRTLLDVFAATLASRGRRVAVAADEAILTYRELSAAAGDLAAALRAHGIGPGDRVGVRIASGTADLYVGILGVLAAGAAYVPVDADDPDTRARWVWRQAGACAVVGPGLAVTLLAEPRGAERALTLEDDAWVIFTSGSTGEPKGVAVTHRAAAAFVDAETRLWTVDPADRVLAGLSVGFDASCEEMWLAWRNGAALVPAPRAVVRSGADLGPWLAERRVTVVSTVPTLAALWDDGVIADVRLLILGGEACPQELGWRLAASREVWNTYGPTEATVVSTASRIRPYEPVTIGRPLDGWQVAIVDPAGERVRSGDAGELVIGGVGLGRYLDGALDEARFARIDALGWERAYRTGDIVRDTPGGLVFVGRHDDQIKLGGRRIELGEIEAQLCAAPGVRAAAAAVKRTRSGNAVLVGYVCGEADPAHVRALVAEWLPAGAVPLVVVLDALPMTPAGKVDRKALPWPPPRPTGSPAPAPAERPLSATAAWLSDLWVDELGPLSLSAASDFFALGGSSLAAAKLVSVLRAHYPSVAVADLYRHRTLEALAARLDELGRGPSLSVPERPAPAGRWGAAQVAGVLLLIAFTAPSWLVGAFAVDRWQGIGPQVPWPWLVGAWLLFISPPGRLAIAIAARSLLIGRLRPGRYPRRGSIAMRLWFVERLGVVLHVDRSAGTPWAPRIARLLGARVGPGARLGTLPALTSLVDMGAGATLEAHVDAHGWWIEGDELVVGELRIGAGARVGARSVLMPGTDIGAGAEIEPGSVVSTPVPAGERWAGSPARRIGLAGESWPEGAPAPAPHARLWQMMFGLGSFALSLVGLVAAIPVLLIYAAVSSVNTSASAALNLALSAPVLAAGFIVGEAVVAALVFRAAARLIRPGWHPDTGGVAWALWFTGQLTESTLGALFPLYATIYTRAWLRLHGLRVGRRTEVSTTQGLDPLVTLGDTCFVADHPLFAGARAHRGWLHLDPIEIGDRTFIGNGAVLGAGATVGSDCLIGIESNAPAHSPDGTSWFGAPPLELPRVPDPTDPARTTDPPLRLVLARGATEVVRILLPTSFSIIIGMLVFDGLAAIARVGGALSAAAAAPLVIAAGAAVAVLVTVALKWLIIGRYRAGEAPLWSSLVWRDEIINSCQEQLAGEWVMEKALGSPVVSAYLRAMGARIGRDVWCETLAVTEFDVVTIGDGCAVNRGACIETHLFQDRVLRIGPTEMGVGSTLGPVSAILPDTKLGAGCVVGGRSVVLRGEELPAGTAWHGSPVVST